MPRAIPQPELVLGRGAVLLANNDPLKALAALDEIAEQSRFSEQWHDLAGQCFWHMSLECQHRPLDRNGTLGGLRTEYELVAGRHWYLTSRDDESSRHACELVREQYAAFAPDLFHHLRFPKWPFGEFASRVVCERLPELRTQLSAAGYDDEQLYALLDPAQYAPGRQTRGKLTFVGCLVALAVFIGVCIIGILTAVQMRSGIP